MLRSFFRHHPLVTAVRHNALLASARCPSCSLSFPTALPTCPNCKHIAPIPSTMTFFQYFNLPTSESSNLFTIDTRDLHRRFLQAQRVCHPDAWSQQGKNVQALAVSQSTQLNKAYRTLLSPLDRANYILSLNGIEQSDTEKLEDEEFIMQVMEARQEVEEASNAEELSRLKEINQGRMRKTEEDIRRLIGKKDWQAAKLESTRLKYWLGIEKAASEWNAG